MTDLTHTLDEIKRVTEAATEGPWVHPHILPGHVGKPGSFNDAAVAGRANAEFIALARTALPELVAEVERLREEVEFERGSADHAHDHVMGWRKRAEAAEAEVERLRSLARTLSSTLTAAQDAMIEGAGGREANDDGGEIDWDQVYDRLHSSPWVRAEAAEATIERVRDWIEADPECQMEHAPCTCNEAIRSYDNSLRAALDGTQP